MPSQSQAILTFSGADRIMRGMSKLLDKAIERLRRLPAGQQDDFARELLERIEEEAEWDVLVGGEKSLTWLEKQAASVRAEIAAG